MKAAVYLGPGHIDIQDVPTPECGPGEVLLAIDACSVCGTDVRIYKHGHRKVTPPRITGHEICATVKEVGAGVTDVQVGDRVVVVTEVGCGHCVYCLQKQPNMCETRRAIGYAFDGGFAEYMKVPAEAVAQGNLLKVPEGLDPAHASLVEPLACCLNGQRFLNIGLGDTVVVFGAGPIGCMHLLLARLQGASKTILINHSSQERLEMAARFNPDVSITASQEDPVAAVLEATGGRGADVVIVACSSPTAQEQAIAMAATRGRVSLFGGLPGTEPRISFDSNRVHYKELAVFGAASAYHHLYQQALDYISQGIIPAEQLITHQFGLEDTAKAIETAARGSALKVVVRPHQGR